MFLFQSTLAFAMNRANKSNQDTNYKWVERHSPTHAMMTHLKQDKSTPKLLNSRLCVCVTENVSRMVWPQPVSKSHVSELVMHVGERVRFCHHCQEQMSRQGCKPVHGCNSVKHWGAKTQHGLFRHRQPIASLLDACFIKYACALHGWRHFQMLGALLVPEGIC